MPLAPAVSVATTLVLCALLSGLAYYRKVLTADGTMAAFGVGMIIGIFGDVTWLLLLLFFLVSSFGATRYRFALKEAMGVQEGARGERRAANVLANGLAPAAIAVLGFPGWGTPLLDRELSGLLFVSALAVAGADTLASEIGILSEKVRLITNGRPVKPGTDGGVSWLGQAAALAAAVYSALFGYLVLVPFSAWAGLSPPYSFPISPLYLVIPAVVGFLGCQIDSVFGATLEQRGILDKRTNNLASTSLGAVIAFVLFEVVVRFT
ncbi:MAG TPA: DUF92 domain-containing protein [Thermoplasmata archaeon]|jgi:uncharacterized protein (TIGR00297 family)|nr:DUF92 domain-containing protein [Thermoplasmata archaeon]